MLFSLVKEKKLYQNVFKICLFHTKYTAKCITNPLTYLLTYHLRLTCIDIIQLYLEYYIIAQCLFKMGFN